MAGTPPFMPRHDSHTSMVALALSHPASDPATPHAPWHLCPCSVATHLRWHYNRCSRTRSAFTRAGLTAARIHVKGAR